MSTVIYLENALTPQLRRVEQGSGSIRSLAPDWQVPFVAFLDGRPVLRADWELVLEDDQALAFIEVAALPQGGGGGGSDAMRMVAMLAVMVAAPQIGAFMTSQMLGGAVLGLSATTWTGIAMFAGMSLVNAIIPPPKPPSTQQAAALAAPSPTYSLQAQGNSARLDSAIPEHFGRMIAYPDYAAQPYSEFSGNEQFLYQLLCIGRGQYSIESIRIEDTPIASFDEITYEVVAPGGSLTLFPANVISSTEVSGQDLPCKAATYSQSGTTVTVTLVGHGMAAGKSVYLDYTSGTAVDGTFTVVTAPTADTFTVTAAAALTTSGNVTVSPWLGGFIASGSGTSSNYIGLDFVLPRGLYYANTDGSLANVSLTVTSEARTVDSAGSPTSAWVTLGTPTYTAGTTTPQRNSERYSVTAGRYEVRVRRVDIEQTDTRYGHDIAWAGMRAYLPDTRTFGDVTLLAMRMRASNNLSLQASRKVNVICTRMIPVWNGSTWSANTATRAPAWAIAYACKQIGMADSQIDLAGLLTLDATCTSRGDFFDARFDNFLTFWEAVTKIAGAVRAKPFLQGGVLRIMRDQAATIPVALFSVRNIVRGSFSINYLMPTADTADAVDVKYFDSNSWAQATVRAKLTGSSALVPAKVQLFGVVGRDQAFREGMYQAASNRYRRKIITFKTEMEGFIPSFGDLIAIQHDMPAWGQGGEVVAYESSVTNYALQSEDFTNAAWARDLTSTITGNVSETMAPNGEQTADKMLEVATTGGHFVYQLVTRAAGAHTVSVYVKAAERQWVAVQIATDALAKRYTVLVDLNTGAALSTQSVGSPVSPSYAIASAGNGWWRVSVTATHASGILALVVCASNSATPTWSAQAAPSYTGSTSNGLYVFGGMVEALGASSMYVRTTSAAATAGVLRLSDDTTWGTGTHYIGLRTRSGGVDGPYVVTSGATASEVILASTPAIAPYTGTNEERTHYAFGWAETWRQQARVLSVTPQSLTTVEITAVNEDSNVHTAESGATTPVQVTSQLAGYTNAPDVLGLVCRSMPDSPEKMLLTWQASPWADYYLVEQSSDGVRWTRTGEPTTSNYTATALYGNATLIRVAAVGIARGPWRQVNYGSSADYMWNSVDTTLMWNAVTTTPMWRY